MLPALLSALLPINLRFADFKIADASLLFAFRFGFCTYVRTARLLSRLSGVRKQLNFNREAPKAAAVAGERYHTKPYSA